MTLSNRYMTQSLTLSLVKTSLLALTILLIQALAPTLAFAGDISVSQQPASLSKSSGQYALFTVKASGSTSVSYQWYKNGVAVSGATKNWFSITAVKSSDAGTYRVRLKNTKDQIFSANATLSVDGSSGSTSGTSGTGTTTTSASTSTSWTSLPGTYSTTAIKITTQPLSQKKDLGKYVQFSVSASSTLALSYQWYKNGTAISGATKNWFSINSVKSTDAGSYYVKVNSSKGYAYSKIATLNSTAPTTGGTSGSTSGTGSAYITWKKPVARENGSTLSSSDIKVFRVYHTSSIGQESVYEVPGYQTNISIAGLKTGSHQFAITALDYSSRESDLSSVVNKKVY